MRLHCYTGGCYDRNYMGLGPYGPYQSTHTAYSGQGISITFMLWESTREPCTTTRSLLTSSLGIILTKELIYEAQTLEQSNIHLTSSYEALQIHRGVLCWRLWWRVDTGHLSVYVLRRNRNASYTCYSSCLMIPTVPQVNKYSTVLAISNPYACRLGLRSCITWLTVRITLWYLQLLTSTMRYQ